jgi:hypothetical protein
MKKRSSRFKFKENAKKEKKVRILFQEERKKEGKEVLKLAGQWK